MYNELWLSKFVVIKEDKREISSVAKGVWILNGLWESGIWIWKRQPHPSNYMSPSVSTFHSEVTSCFISVSFFFYFLHYYTRFHLLLFRGKEPHAEDFFLCLKIETTWKYRWDSGVYDIPIFFPYVLASQTLR